jgi:hypothetical protein
MPLVLSGSTGITSDNIADASISAADLASSLNLTGKTITSPLGFGNILQVAGDKLDNEITYSGSWSGFQNQGAVDGSNFYVTLTPRSTTSKFIAFYQMYWRKTTYQPSLFFELMINDAIANDITGTSHLAGLYTGHRIQVVSDSYFTNNSTVIYQPTSTSAHTFKLNLKIYDENSSFNIKMFPSATKIYVMEVA